MQIKKVTHRSLQPGNIAQQANYSRPRGNSYFVHLTFSREILEKHIFGWTTPLLNQSVCSLLDKCRKGD